MKLLLLLPLLAIASADDHHNLRGPKHDPLGKNLRELQNNPPGADFCYPSPCGCLRPGCCCVPADGGGLTQSCSTLKCPQAEPSPEVNRNGVDCGGRGFYTVFKPDGTTSVVCNGTPSETPLPNRADEDEFQVIVVPEDKPIPDVPEDDIGQDPVDNQGLVCSQDVMRCPTDSDDETPSYVNRDPNNGCQFKPCAPTSKACTIPNWNLSGRGEDFSCTSNDQCQFGCCSSQDSQVPGRCISPLINPQFATALKCMPEFSRCEVNRALSLPIPEAPKVPVLINSIDTCDPENARSPCCETSADCQGYGAGCCDKWRKQCVPVVNRVVLNNIECVA